MISNITESHIDIISLEKGSIKVSFNVKPDDNGNSITKTEVKKIFKVGKLFNSIGKTVKTVEAKEPELPLFTVSNPFGEDEISVSKGKAMGLTFIIVLLGIELSARKNQKFNDPRVSSFGNKFAVEVIEFRIASCSS